jgi:hypothetical protein
MLGLNRLKRSASRTAVVLVFIFLLALTANAYTIVMHGGRRVEIPARFVVTTTTLTYEVSPGVQITIALAAINVPATEKTNNELPGSFMRRVQSGTSGLQESSQPGNQMTNATQARRTITNRDLESSRRRRRDSELAYENRRKQLGLPSLEESRKLAAAESDSMGLELENLRVAERESENYWRERAGALRTETAALDAELAYIRARLDQDPFAVSNGAIGGWSRLSLNTITRGVSFGNFASGQFGNFGGSTSFPGRALRRPNIFVAPRESSRVTARATFGGRGTRAEVFLNPGAARHGRRDGVGGGGRFSTPWDKAVFGSTVPAYDYPYERGALITQFNELAAARAGLSARWRELEDEARRAGAPPGWLRR